MPNRPRRNAAAVASIRMEDSFEDIESNSSVSPTPPSRSPTPVRQKKLKQLPVVKSAQKQRAKQVQKSSVQKKTHVIATVERPIRAAAVATYDSGDEDSLTDEMRGRLLPFILNFDDEEQDRIRPGSRSACYLDSDDEKMGVTARLRIVQEEASSSNRKRKKDRREARTTSRKKKAQAPEKASAKKSRYTPLTIISTGRGVGSSGKSKTKGKARQPSSYSSSSSSSSSGSENECSFASDPSVAESVHSFTPPSPSTPPLGPFDRGKLQQSRKKIRANVSEAKTAKTKLSFSSPATTVSKAKSSKSKNKQRKSKQSKSKQSRDKENFDFDEEESEEDEIPARKSYIGNINPPVLKRSAAYLESTETDDSCEGGGDSDDSDVSFANAKHARKRNSQTPKPKTKTKRNIGKSRRR
ncbi:hypothetical protein TL16_g00475 [Triparma laevis f. inornata]|uniref:Uncharacterized protein n=2 Tax=Triparma laevis TaxID=1534972 RepID=A0A9W6ZF20_9STRA|nr:hypothetical protein TL16_g00475 [Triparma laevis f. inornata]GMH49898.1 hypothetical protein TrLO_g5040 [Triparma laevis f. longispina]